MLGEGDMGDSAHGVICDCHTTRMEDIIALPGGNNLLPLESEEETNTTTWDGHKIRGFLGEFRP